MKREDVPAGQHLAIPTKDSETLHEGSYPHHCELCQAAAAQLVVSHRPSLDGFVISVGSIVRLKAEHRFSDEPEWVTITGSRLNTYTGEIWLSAFALGENRVLTAGDFEEIRL